jgi:ABC-type phosphate/phosphonate transport system ATPase subunit
MNNYANETNKKRKIKKIVIINYKHNKPFNNTSLRNIDKNFDKNNSILFPEIKKDILKKQRNKNNLYNSKKIISKSNIIPEIKQNNNCSIITSSFNIIDNSTISKNVNLSRNNQSSFHKSYNTSIESSLIYYNSKKS